MKLKEVKTGYDLIETFSFHPDITWSDHTEPTPNGKQTIEYGDFFIEDEHYRIQLDWHTVNINPKIDTAIELGFGRIIDGIPQTELIPSKHPNKVFGGVFNGTFKKISNNQPDVIIFSSKKKNAASEGEYDSRSSLYAIFANRVQRMQGYSMLFKHINNDGTHFIMIKKSIPLTDEETDDILAALKTQ